MQSNLREFNHHWVWSVVRAALRTFVLLLLLMTPVTNPANTTSISSNEAITCKYDFNAAYDLGVLISDIASQIVSRDLSADRYSKSEKMTSEQDSNIYTIYERDAVRVEFSTVPSSTDSSERTIWNAHIPAEMLPDYLLPKQYYFSKLGLNVDCNKFPILEVESDVGIVVIKFNDDIVTSITLKGNSGAD